MATRFRVRERVRGWLSKRFGSAPPAEPIAEPLSVPAPGSEAPPLAASSQVVEEEVATSAAPVASSQMVHMVEEEMARRAAPVTTDAGEPRVEAETRVAPVNTQSGPASTTDVDEAEVKQSVPAERAPVSMVHLFKDAGQVWTQRTRASCLVPRVERFESALARARAFGMACPTKNHAYPRRALPLNGRGWLPSACHITTSSPAYRNTCPYSTPP